MKKLIYSLFVSFFALTLITSCTSNDSKLGLHDPESEYATTIGSRDRPYKGVQESEYAPRNLGTKLIKKAIRVVINNIPKAKKVIKKVSGPEVAESFVKYAGKVADALEPLLAYSELTAQIVYDQVRNGLVNVGVSEVIAVNIALAIKNGLDWFILP